VRPSDFQGPEIIWTGRRPGCSRIGQCRDREWADDSQTSSNCVTDWRSFPAFGRSGAAVSPLRERRARQLAGVDLAQRSECDDPLDEGSTGLRDEFELSFIAERRRFLRCGSLDGLYEWHQMIACEGLRRILLLLDRELNWLLAHLLAC
jgi:hypothetical protein